MRSFALGWILFVVVAALALPAAGQTDPPTIDVGDLLAEPEVWDGERLRLEGELVGDYSDRPSGVWVQLNDDPYATAPVPAGGTPVGANTAIGALVPEGLFDEVVGGPGRYGRSGPLVRVEGTFRHNDPRVGGETYLEVDTVATLRAAAPYPTGGIDTWFFVGIVLVGTAASLAWRARRI